MLVTTVRVVYKLSKQLHILEMFYLLIASMMALGTRFCLRELYFITLLKGSNYSKKYEIRRFSKSQVSQGDF